MSAEDNKAHIRRYVDEVINPHRLELEAEFVAPELVEEGVQHLGQLFDAFPDIRSTIEDLFGEGDRVWPGSP